MSIHTHHPDSHEFGLADNCPRCREHAEQLDSLDTSNLVAIYQRLSCGQAARSQMEQVAMYNLEHYIAIARRLGWRKPDQVSR